jgi:hypothetical protein
MFEYPTVKPSEICKNKNLGERKNSTHQIHRAASRQPLRIGCMLRESGFRGGKHEIFALLGFYDTITFPTEPPCRDSNQHSATFFGHATPFTASGRLNIVETCS